MIAVFFFLFLDILLKWRLWPHFPAQEGTHWHWLGFSGSHTIGYSLMMTTLRHLHSMQWMGHKFCNSVTRSQPLDFPWKMFKIPTFIPTIWRHPNFFQFCPKLAFYCSFINKYFVTRPLNRNISKFNQKLHFFKEIHLYWQYKINKPWW